MERNGQNSFNMVDARQPLSHFAPNSRVPVDEVYFPQVNWPEPIGPRARFPKVQTAWNEPTHFWRQDPDDTTCVPLAYANACEAIGVNPDNDFLRCMIALAQTPDERGLRIGTHIDSFVSIVTLLDSSKEVGKLNGTDIFLRGVDDIVSAWGNLLITYFSSRERKALMAAVINNPPDEKIPVLIDRQIYHEICIAGLRFDQEGQMDVLVIDSETGVSAVPIDGLARVLEVNESPVTVTRVRGADRYRLRPTSRNRQQYDQYFLKTMMGSMDRHYVDRVRETLHVYEASEGGIEIADIDYTIL